MLMAREIDQNFLPDTSPLQPLKPHHQQAGNKDTWTNLTTTKSPLPWNKHAKAKPTIPLQQPLTITSHHQEESHNRSLPRTSAPLMSITRWVPICNTQIIRHILASQMMR